MEGNTQATPSKRDRDFAVSKRSRGRSGCLNCRRRRKKCDETKPDCAKCTTRGEVCEWDTGITFRLSGIDSYHPSMVHSRNLKTHNEYQIMNVTFDDSKGALQHTYQEQHDAMSQHSSSSFDEQSVEDVQEGHSDINVALPDHEQILRTLSRDSGAFSTHSVSITGAPLERRPSTQTMETSTQLHVSEDGLINSTAGSKRSTSKGTPNHHESNVGTFPLSLPHISAPIEMPGLPTNMAITPGFRTTDPFNSETREQQLPTSTFSELEALDYLTCQPNNLDSFATVMEQDGLTQRYTTNNSVLIQSPFATASTLGDSADLRNIFYPSATYQDLHSTLYRHMVETARNTALTRQATPDPFGQEAPPILHDAPSSSSNVNNIRSPVRELGLRLQPLKSGKLAQRRHFELWRNYLDEVAMWLDMFHNDRHFQFKIPLLAKSADHLHYSILALSARQMERKDPDKPYTESLGLYQEAIRLIVKELYTLDTAVIASCVLLCVLEMMISSPRAWGRHLDGCAMLLEAAGVNGVVGGVRQSLFWCFARMHVWGGYLEDTLTKIPTSRWVIPSGSMIDAVTHFKAGSGSDSYANYAVFLCASVVNVTSNKTGPHVERTEMVSVTSTTYAARWKALFDLLEDWYINRSEAMQPLMAYPSSADEPREPFPVVLYNNPPAVNGNSLYHAAAILMLQNKPKGMRLSRSPKSILWHARQICGIAVSNGDHGAWINSLQPLWIAGKIMSHETEHRAILELLAQIERESGWATAWRAEDLRDYWGETEFSET
ncbi:Zn(II)2Cys6 transcription factor [Exophiala viscosa]|uniref:Zn(II)2Cys6 transcription factor n=1 Tax=Exophiala viscosa TaxID=2486360 RepID=A0AAN6E4A1_9EURO|nr:Zn(II)2Cys6 transcription factor [Exophiala viscosa]